MAEDPSVPLDLQPGSIVMIKGRSWVVDALRAGRDGDTEIQTTRRTERRSETVLWPADVVQGLVLRRRAQGAPPASFGLGAVLQEYERSGEVREIGATGAAAQGVAASSGRRRRRYPAPAGDVAGTADYALERGSGRRCVTRRQCPPSSFIRRAPHSERCS